MLIPQVNRFRNSEFIRYHKDVVSLCNSNNAAALKISAQVNALDAAIVPLNALFVQQRASLYSEKLAALDLRRDDALIGIRALADAYTYHVDASLKEAGMTLLACIDKYGRRIPILNYVAETEVLVNLVADMESNDKVKQAVQTLGITSWVAELKQANTDFNALYLTRTSDYAEKPETNALDLKAEVTDKFRQLCNFINSYQTLTPSAAYDKLISELNSLTAQYNSMVGARNHADDVENNTPAPPQPPH